MTKYSVTGMTCAACSARVEKAVGAVPGVTAVSVNLLTNAMGVEGDAPTAAVVAAVEKAGYGAALKADGGVSRAGEQEDVLADKETPLLRKRLIASLCFLLPLMYVAMGNMMWGWPLPAFLSGNHLAIGLCELLLTAIIMVINQRFFTSGFSGLIHKAPNMDTLVALGATAAFGYSAYALFAMTGAVHSYDMARAAMYMNEFYFESAAMILTLITLGKLLEAYSKGKTTNALKNLMRLTPQTATLLVEGKEEVVDIERVRAGDTFVVRSGESIPVDGVVIDGAGAVDESALTGESLPVDKTAGDSVSAATINRSGFITCQATRVGADTTLAQIIQMVSDAAATKAPISKVADRVSGVFVPVVIAIALLTIAIWVAVGEAAGFALARGISVLVISCPCALGLATPVAIMVGNGKGAQSGILFKTAASLEAAGKTEIIALDKTGTITHGQPRVTDVITAEAVVEAELLAIAYALEQKSEHPLANAVMEYGRERGLKAHATTDFAVAAGNGLSASIDGTPAVGGNAAFIEKHVTIPAPLQQQAEQLAQAGKTPLYFAYGSRLLGIIAVADVIKENAAAAIGELKNLGVAVVMLTGDNRRTATAISAQIGIEHVISDVLPAEKEAQIRMLAQQGRVAMVGDGINDAPALTRADVGIAIGAGTDVAIDAADVVLVKSGLEDLPAAIRLSRGVLKNIHQNLFWAFFYNVIGIPLAAGALIPVWGIALSPMFAAAAMSLSSFCVVTNALRLNWIRIYDPGQDKKPETNVNLSFNYEKEDELMKKTMSIEGMMCAHCEARVRTSLEAIEGVVSAEVTHDNGTAVVTLNDAVDAATLQKAVEEQGYAVRSIAE